MPTPHTPRLARASSAALVALALAACSDSTGPTNTVPDGAQAEQAAFYISQEILSSLSGLTAEAAMSAPMSGIPARTVAPFRPMAARAECGSYSPATPLDGDQDGIFDVVTITFAAADCHFADDAGGYTELTGQLHVEDESSESGNISFSLGLTDLRLRMHDAQNGDFTVTQNGSGSVTHAGSSLTQVHNFATAISGLGITSSVTANWTNDFDAESGSAVVAGSPLPNGTFTPSGTTVWRQGPNQFTFALSAPTPLSYSAACAADPVTYPNPFSAGTLRVNVTGSEGSAYVDIVYADCLDPEITYHGAFQP